MKADYEKRLKEEIATVEVSMLMSLQAKYTLPNKDKAGCKHLTSAEDNLCYSLMSNLERCSCCCRS